MPEQWRRALLRPALREVGYDAIGARGILEARLVHPEVPERGPVGLVVVDQAALAGAWMPALHTLRERHQNPPIILLGRATVDAPEGVWHRVLGRPLSIAHIVSEVKSALPLPADARGPVDFV